MRAKLGAGLVVLAMALAGCVGGEGSAQGRPQGGATGPAAEPTASGDFGSITGQVVNEEFAPIAGARIAVMELEAPTQVTDDLGKFTFNDVPPGSYSVFAEQLGFESKAQKVTVAAGEVSTVKFTLTAIAASSVKRSLSYIADGFIEAAFVVPTCCVYYFNVTGQTNAVVLYKVAGDAETSVTGVTWSTSAPFTGRYVRANAWLCKPATTCSEVNFTRSFSPLVVRSDGLQDTIEGKNGYFVGAQFYPTACNPTTQTEFCATNPDTLMTVTVQQRYKVYTTVFFAEPGPEGYSPVP